MNRRTSLVFCASSSGRPLLRACAKEARLWFLSTTQPRARAGPSLSALPRSPGACFSSSAVSLSSSRRARLRSMFSTSAAGKKASERGEEGAVEEEEQPQSQQAETTTSSSASQQALAVHTPKETGLSQDYTLSAVQLQSDLRGDGMFPYKVIGHENQSVEVDIAPGEGIRAEVGSLVWMSEGVEMDTQTGGGVGKAVARYMTGESFFVTDFNNTGSKVARVGFGSNYPTKIIPFRLRDHDSQLICQKGAFLCGSKEVDIEMHFTKSFASGFFGGEGFILQKLVGNGLVLAKGGGSIIKRTLAEGEVMRVSAGSLVAFESTIDFDVEMIKGGKNLIFGGEGLFFSTLKGPGTVWIQSLPFDKFVDALAYRLSPGGGGYGPLLAAATMGGMGGGTPPPVASGGGGEGGGAGGAEGAAKGAGAAAGASGDPEAPPAEEEDKWGDKEASRGGWGDEEEEDEDDDEEGEGGGWFSSLFGDDG
ncbi:Mitochondrial biogenesis AIM24 [Balamuthia mandrillaris]